ncbi:hypothetical protein F4810DRAFT_692595 [Camillea tinctor]|nr:hypothetical protein F4810DRAFT_692595 [Camillea tinctor]
MDKYSSQAFLDRLWSGMRRGGSTCCQCGLEIGPTEVLVRTFALQTSGFRDIHKYTEKIEVHTIAEAILVYHRHLSCLLESTKYVTVSHVWHPAVADLQYRRGSSDASIEEVASIVREVPPRIYLALAKIIQQPFEVWHDYISVPQWQDDIKISIIEAIPMIFKQAFLTVAYLSDIESSTVNAMRNGKSMQTRVRGISDICNAKWFSRTWTAMELVQSHQLLAMLKDYVILDDGNSSNGGGSGRGLFVEELSKAWSAEVRARGDSHKVEDMAEIGKNLVPWQLGPLTLIRECNLRGQRVTFAMAYELLACRCVTNRRDFFHALLGVVDTGLTEAELSADEPTAMLQVARGCLANGTGDYSPLFMIPRRRRHTQCEDGEGEEEEEEEDARKTSRRGYLDLKIFVLGHPERAPAITDIRLRPDGVTIRAEVVGTVAFATREHDVSDQGAIYPPLLASLESQKPISLSY